MVASGPQLRCLLLGLIALLLGATAAAAEPLPEPPAEEVAPLGDSQPLPGGADPLFDDDWADEAIAGPAVYDPLEETNRKVLRFNQQVDTWVWDPLNRGYRFVVPEVGRRSIRRVFNNLQTPVYLVNHLFQLRPLDAAETLGAFVMNTLWGLGGILDAASAANLERKPADFGQTLAFVGFSPGPYLMVPLFGPTTVRDGFGGVVDFFLHPLTYFLPITTLAIWGGSDGFARRDAVVDKLDALEEGAIDYYAVLRSAYVQHRAKIVARSRRGRSDPLDALVPVEGAAPGL